MYQKFHFIKKRNLIITYKFKTMKKTSLNTADQFKKLGRADMKKINGGKINGCVEPRCFICGCIDLDENFYRGGCGAGYCNDTYGGEPWCVRVC
jgi:hypothetical protein